MKRLSILLAALSIFLISAFSVSAETMKDMHEVIKEKSMLIKEKAKEMGIDTEGKENEPIKKEMKVAYVKMYAEAYGIDTNGKDIDALTHELREAYL